MRYKYIFFYKKNTSLLDLQLTRIDEEICLVTRKIEAKNIEIKNKMTRKVNIYIKLINYLFVLKFFIIRIK